MIFLYENKYAILLTGFILGVSGMQSPALIVAGFACFAFYFYLISRFPKTSDVNAFAEIARQCTSSKLSGFDREQNIETCKHTSCVLQGIVRDRVNTDFFWLYVPSLGANLRFALDCNTKGIPFNRGDHVEVEFYPKFRLNSLARRFGTSAHEVDSNLPVVRIARIR